MVPTVRGRGEKRGKREGGEEREVDCAVLKFS